MWADIKPDFTDADNGTQVYSPAYGFGRILIVNTRDNRCRPIRVEFTDGPIVFFTNDGRTALKSNLMCVLFYVDGDNKFAERPPLPEIDPSKIPVDTEVLVCNSGYDGPGIHRKYSRNNKVFANGRCLFTWDAAWDAACLEEWDIFKLAEPVTINNVEYPVGYTWRAR